LEDKAWEYINNAWGCFTVVDPENNLKEPTSRQQIADSKPWLEKAKAENPTDQRTVALINELEQFYPIWYQRHFDGAPAVIMGGIGVGVLLLLLYIPFIRAAFAGEEGVWQVIMKLFWPLVWFIGGTIFYYIASRTPRWLIDKRNRKARADKMMQQFGWGFVRKLAESDRTYKVKWSDGSVTTEQEFGGTLAALLIMITYFSINTVLLPVRGVINYIRNYVAYSA